LSAGFTGFNDSRSSGEYEAVDIWFCPTGVFRRRRRGFFKVEKTRRER